MKKTCTKCKNTKSLDAFYKRTSKKDGHTGECKQCITERSNARYLAKKQEILEKSRWTTLLRVYGITQQQYEEMSVQQNNRCAICGSSNGGGNGKGQLFVDHDHETGEIRGLLCHGCNTAIGLLRDDPELLISATSYLMQFHNVLEGS